MWDLSPYGEMLSFSEAVSGVLAGALLVLFRMHRRLRRRMDEHAASIGNMDDWADAVDARLLELEGRFKTANSNYVSRQLGLPQIGAAAVANDSMDAVTDHVRAVVAHLRAVSQRSSAA